MANGFTDYAQMTDREILIHVAGRINNHEERIKKVESRSIWDIIKNTLLIITLVAAIWSLASNVRGECFEVSHIEMRSL